MWQCLTRDGTGQGFQWDPSREKEYGFEKHFGDVLFDEGLEFPLFDDFTRKRVLLDTWGHRVYWCCPGPIHKNGWDLISCGPNGVYEDGGGDDIVVGENIPGGIAAINSR